MKEKHFQAVQFMRCENLKNVKIFVPSFVAAWMRTNMSPLIGMFFFILYKTDPFYLPTHLALIVHL